MKLSELVDYLNHIDAFELGQIHQEARHRLDAVIHKIANHNVQFNKFTQGIIANGNKINESFQQFNHTIDAIRSHVIDAMAAQHPEYLRESLRLFQHEMCYDTTEHILNRRLRCDPESDELLQGRILRYTDWRVPGLIFRPALEQHVEQLVPLDPLYMIDNNLELLEPACQGFTEEYRRRLRLYTAEEILGKPILPLLPDSQFGYCFAYNYFNYKPLELICQYLDELWKKLRPGGVVFFTYNDCDRAHGVALAERSYMCYTPGSLIQEHAEALGFELMHRHNGPADVAWFEFQKPGEIDSLRGGQTLARIVANSK
jgi:hypothetical protein